MFCIYPVAAYTQDYPAGKVDVSYKEATVNDILKDLKKRFTIEFLYNLDEVKHVKPLTFDMKQATITQILDRTFSGTNLSYKLVDNVIVIAVKPPVQAADKLRSITGHIRTEEGEALAGATVAIKGTTIGASSNVEGKYMIGIPSGEQVELIVSFIGMKPVEVRVSKNTEVYDIVLEEDEVLMEDVVVTGYGNIRETSFTGSHTKITRDELLRVSPGNIINALQIFDPALRVERNNEMGSDPNTLPDFYIRGKSGMAGVSEMDQFEAIQNGEISKFSLVKNPNTPIFILDGFEIDVEKVFDLDPQRIKDVTILKDAAATAIYGSRASNGVIVIETLAPKPGQFRVNYNLTGAVTMPDLTGYNLMNAREKLDAEVASGLLDGTDRISNASSTFLDRVKDYLQKLNMVELGVDTYWLSQPLRTPVNHKHSLYIEGGAETVRLGLTLRYDNGNGVMKGSYRNRVGVGLNARYQMKKLQIQNNFTFDVVKSKNSPYGDFSKFASQQPYDSPRDPLTGEIVKLFPSYFNRRSASQRLNPFYEIQLKNDSGSNYRDWSNNLSINWFITDHLHIKGQFAINYKLSESRTFRDPDSGLYENSVVADKGELFLSEATSLGWDTNLFAAYNNVFGSHFITASLGFNAKDNQTDSESARYIGFPSGSLSDVGYANRIAKKPDVQDNHTRLAGFFMTLNYTYKDIYLADASVRLDGSSEFGTKSRFSQFWSLGAGLNVHNYDLMKSNYPLISRLKLTANYGITGKANFPPYASRNSYAVQLDDWYRTGIGATMIAMGNENLKWERSKALNLSLNLGLWKNRYNAIFMWYDRKSLDMITDVGIPLSTGFTAYKDNMGEVGNKGFELKLSGRIISTHDAGLYLFGNIGHNSNKILKLSKSMEAYNDRIDDHFNGYLNGTREEDKKFSKPFMKYVVGGSLNAITGMKSLGISPGNGKDLYEYRDGTVSYAWRTQEQQILGNREPDFHGSFGINVNYKGFSLYTTFTFEWGGQAYNETLVNKVENLDIYNGNADKRILTDRWRKPGDVTPLKSIYESNITTRPTSRFVQDNNNFTFNSVSLEYEFDKMLIQRIGMRTLKLQFNMDNVGTISSIKQERGTMYPFARTLNFTVNASF